MVRKNRSSGFTLIELLVVIAIIALLVSILLPALGRARGLALQPVSRTQITHLTSGHAAFAEYNKDNPSERSTSGPMDGRVGIGKGYHYQFGFAHGANRALRIINQEGLSCETDAAGLLRDGPREWAGGGPVKVYDIATTIYLDEVSIPVDVRGRPLAVVLPLTFDQYRALRGGEGQDAQDGWPGWINPAKPAGMLALTVLAGLILAVFAWILNRRKSEDKAKAAS